MADWIKTEFARPKIVGVEAQLDLRHVLIMTALQPGSGHCSARQARLLSAIRVILPHDKQVQSHRHNADEWIDNMC